MITRKARYTAIGRCKGIDGLSLSETWKETEDRVSCKGGRNEGNNEGSKEGMEEGRKEGMKE